MKKRKSVSSLDNLLMIMKKLRSPGGCPWDRAQTHDTIKTFLLAETYEALETINKRNWMDLKEELGDLLFQIVFHARMCEEGGLFAMEDVIGGIIRKLKERHPHVFGTKKIRSAEEQTAHWNRLKAKEKGGSLLDRVPSFMPALLQAHELQDRAHRLGFKWNHISKVQKKLREELNELSRARKSRKKDAIEDELGDVLFMIANLARWLSLNPEMALLRANAKFRKRFAYLEKEAKKKKLNLARLSSAELERLWRKAKEASSTI